MSRQPADASVTAPVLLLGSCGPANARKHVRTRSERLMSSKVTRERPVTIKVTKPSGDYEMIASRFSTHWTRPMKLLCTASQWSQSIPAQQGACLSAKSYLTKAPGLLQRSCVAFGRSALTQRNAVSA